MSTLKHSSHGATDIPQGLRLKKISRNHDIDIRTFKEKVHRKQQLPLLEQQNSMKKQGQQLESEKFNPNNLRIVGGLKKGMKIDSPEVYLRPMMSKVRTAVFNSLSFMELFNVNDTRVLDIFSGSGSVGLEALSRGASHATFVDMSSNCIETCLRNAVKLGFKGRVATACAKAEDVLHQPSSFGLTVPYQLVSMTPPYEEVSYDLLIKLLCETSIIDDNAIVIIEYPMEMGALPFIIGERKLVGLRNRRYGRTIIGMYVYKPTRHFDFREGEFQQENIRKKKPR